MSCERRAGSRGVGVMMVVVVFVSVVPSLGVGRDGNAGCGVHWNVRAGCGMRGGFYGCRGDLVGVSVMRGVRRREEGCVRDVRRLRW